MDDASTPIRSEVRQLVLFRGLVKGFADGIVGGQVAQSGLTGSRTTCLLGR